MQKGFNIGHDLLLCPAIQLSRYGFVVNQWYGIARASQLQTFQTAAFAAALAPRPTSRFFTLQGRG